MCKWGAEARGLGIEGWRSLQSLLWQLYDEAVCNSFRSFVVHQLSRKWETKYAFITFPRWGQHVAEAPNHYTCTRHGGAFSFHGNSPPCNLQLLHMFYTARMSLQQAHPGPRSSLLSPGILCIQVAASAAAFCFAAFARVFFVLSWGRGQNKHTMHDRSGSDDTTSDIFNI